MRTAEYLLAAVVLWSGCAYAQAPETAGEFKLSVWQHGLGRVDVNGAVVLDREPFDLVFHFSQPMAVLVHASFDGTTHHLALQGAPFAELPGFEQTGMAEGLFNADKEVMLATSAPGYWFYDTPEEHRFTSVEEMAEGWFRCTRHIAQITDVDTDTVLPIAGLDELLYFVFIHRPPCSEELQRYTLEIRWNAR